MMKTVDQVGPALPRGAAGCTDWQPDGDELYRIVYTDEESVEGYNVGVHLSAIQHPNGELSFHDFVEIYLDIAGNGPLSAEQSRALARILLDAATRAEPGFHAGTASRAKPWMGQAEPNRWRR